MKRSDLEHRLRAAGRVIGADQIIGPRPDPARRVVN